jgi:ribosomal protein S18 acetylase RimI-like enzyme
MKIKKLSDEEFYSFFPTKFHELFKETLNYSIMSVREQRELDNFGRLKASAFAGDKLHLAAYDDADNLIGWSTSRQLRMYEFYTMNSGVIPEYRRKGVYSKLIKEVLKEAHQLGYQTVSSNHVMSNNDVIIAKLKLGFKISGIEVFDDFGTTVKLTYFLNETRGNAFEFRTGQKRPNSELKKVFGIE